MRRVLEPLFRNFDNGNFWSPEKEIAYAILSEMQVLMEKSGEVVLWYFPGLDLYVGSVQISS